MPSERHTLYHAQWIRQLLDRGILSGLWWIDTRDMLSDCLTKGSIDKKALRDAQGAGLWRLVHPAKSFRRGRAGSQNDSRVER